MVEPSHNQKTHFKFTLMALGCVLGLDFPLLKYCPRLFRKFHYSILLIMGHTRLSFINILRRGSQRCYAKMMEICFFIALNS